MQLRQLITRKHWIFDMDGTLTIAQHDFDAIRAELGLPQDMPILEALDQLPVAESAALHVQLNEIELELAHQSKPAKGAKQLLDLLYLQGVKLGIVTRNNALNVGVTLQAAGLANYFLPENIVSRDCTPPKPLPAGILKLLENWGANAEDALMIGDHLHDLRSGRAADVVTIYVDPTEEFPFHLNADVCIKQLAELYPKP